MIFTLTKDYRLIWDTSTKVIQNDHEKNWSRSITKLVSEDQMAYESNTFSDIENKISSENLIIDPSLNS